MTTTEPTHTPWRGEIAEGTNQTDGGTATSGNTDTQTEAEAAYEIEKARWDKAAAKATAKAQGKKSIAEAEAIEAEADDARDQRKAESYRARLVNAGRSLARSWRMYRQIMAILSVCVVLVLAWNAQTVATNLGGPNPEWAHYAAEAPLSLPLLVILLLQVAAAQNGRLRRVRPVRRTNTGRYVPTATGLIEAALLAGSVAICTWPAVTADEPRFEEIATSALPPFSLVVSAVLLFVTSDLFSEIFREHRATENGEADNMRRRLELAMDLALEIDRAQHGDNPMPAGDDGLPSISSILRRFKGEKCTAQTAHDLLTRFQQRGEVQS